MRYFWIVAATYLFAAPVIAEDIPHSTTYEICKTGAENFGNVAGMLACLQDETERHDVRLNAAYQCLRTKLSDDEFARLRDRQRQWIAETDVTCASPEGSFLDARLSRSMCRHEAVVDQANYLSTQANNEDCNVPAVTHTPSNLGKWQAVNGWAGTRNLEQWALNIDCRAQTGTFYRDPRDTSFDGIGFVKFEIFDGDDALQDRIVTRASTFGPSANFETTPFIVAALARGAHISINAQDHNGFDLDGTAAHFSLRGSTRAFSACSNQPYQELLRPLNLPFSMGKHGLNTFQSGRWYADWYLLDVPLGETDQTQTKAFSGNGRHTLQISCGRASLAIAMQGRVTIELLETDLSMVVDAEVYGLNFYRNGERQISRDETNDTRQFGLPLNVFGFNVDDLPSIARMDEVALVARSNREIGRFSLRGMGIALDTCLGDLSPL